MLERRKYIRKADLTPEIIAERHEAALAYNRARRANETPKQRKARLAYNTIYFKERREAAQN